MEKYVITISRMFGSRGHEIAGRLAELLQIPVFDRSYVEAQIQTEEKEAPAGEAAELLQTKENAAKTEEAEGGKGFMARLFHREPKGNAADEAQAVFDAQAAVVRRVAEEGSCIILGRCADLVLKDFDRSLNVFIYAPDSARIENCMEMLHTDKDSARALMITEDRSRAEYRRRFQADCSDEISGRQILIDSSVFGVEESAMMLQRAARYLFYGQDC